MANMGKTLLVRITIFFLGIFSLRSTTTIIRYRKFPPKVKLLSVPEYEEVTRKATEESLQALRKFCNSPEINAWKTVNALNNPRL